MSGKMRFAEKRVKIRRAWEQFWQGMPVDEDCVSRQILESWERSRTYGLEFDKADKSLLPEKILRERIRAHQALYDIAIPIMERLHDFTTGSGFLSTLSDDEGYVLKAVGDEKIMAMARKNKLQEGCNRNERRLGTNGIGTPLVTGVPIQVFAEEHYYKLHQQWVCSGAPIFDPSGKPLGVFCLTGLREKVSFHTLGLATSVANSISQQFAMQKAYDEIARIQQRTKVILETVPSGILFLNKELEIIQINSRAAALLLLPETRIVGRKLHEIVCSRPLKAENLHEALNDRNVIIERDGQSLHFMFSLNAAGPENYVVTFVRAESLHKKVHRIIGSEAYFTFDDIVGRNQGMRNAVSLARIAANTNSTVLLTGESGTGKELFAHALHNASKRRNGPFIAINCAALPRSLVESELFGYESGAFTGARREGCAGKFELANEGTIFLDEIGDMPFDVQASLLRVLQNREIIRIGGSKAIKIDVRIIAASNRDLISAIKNNVFRNDLYYRLSVFNIHIPSLRERVDDVRLLADHFLRKYAGLSDKNVCGFTEEAYRVLEGHPWHGNIRELENIIELASHVSPGSAVDLECMQLLRIAHPFQRSAWRAGGSAVKEHDFPVILKAENTPQAVERALAASGGNMRRAADLLGVSRRTLYRKIAAHGLDPDILRRRVTGGGQSEIA
ncbi:MAG: sigma 54-interacting transcriptional regulator [Desulfovibrio sp.]|nr:sigma 54-interacting transcriptional regulator [Desulfovibrio sp.]